MVSGNSHARFISQVQQHMSCGSMDVAAEGVYADCSVDQCKALECISSSCGISRQMLQSITHKHCSSPGTDVYHPDCLPQAVYTITKVYMT